MKVCFAIPSCRPRVEAQACIDKWRDMGYLTAVLRQGESLDADLEIDTPAYLGWAASTNLLAKLVLSKYEYIDWIVGGGDDYLPDPDHNPDCLDADCKRQFNGTFGVMQPTGDRWGADEEWAKAKFPHAPAMIDRIAGSPWMGREWCDRAYGGHGPMFAGYHHLYADEELQCVAMRLGVFWQRRDVLQFHDHPLRKGQLWPEHLVDINSPKSWTEHQQLFMQRKANGWPGHLPKQL